MSSSQLTPPPHGTSPVSSTVPSTGGAPLVEVVAAAIVDDLDSPTQVLAARRTSPAALAGCWELPGGKVEPGEDRLDALHRELREELGVHVRIGDALVGPLDGGRWFLTETPTRRLEMSVWFAQIVTGTPAPLEDHDDLRLLTSATITAVPWLESNAAIVEALAGCLDGRADRGRRSGRGVVLNAAPLDS